MIHDPKNIKIEKLIFYLENHVYCRLAPSKIHGVGVFAIRDIPKGINPFRVIREDKFLTIDKSIIFNSEVIHPNVKKYIKDMYVTEDNVIYINSTGLNNINISYYLNHSDTPNMRTKDGEYFSAIRDIKCGEELTVDYHTYSDEEEI